MKTTRMTRLMAALMIRRRLLNMIWTAIPARRHCGCTVVIFAFLFFSGMILTPTVSASVLIMTNTLIDVGDTTYDGQDIVVVNCTLTVNGPHAFGSLQAVNNAVVTHAPATANQTYSLQLTLTSNLVVDASSKIDVTGRGFLPGYTLG